MSVQRPVPAAPSDPPDASPESKIQLGSIPHELLIAEFNYIATSTNQSSEDRARVSNYYLVTIGASIAAIVFAFNFFGDGLNEAMNPEIVD